jgi:hypothetical protein
MTTGNDRAEGQAYLKVADVACQKKLPWNSKSYSNTCSRMAKVAEVEERMINGEQTTVVNYYCTQHTKDYKDQVHQRRINRHQSDNRRRETISLREDAARLALELLRLQGMDGLSQTAPWRHEELVEECRILRAEVERLKVVLD